MLRSVNNIVIAPAKTGKLVTKRTAVMATAHKNRGIESSLKEKDDRALIIVLKKLIDPKMDLIPAKCRLKIAISTETPE